MRGVSVTMAEDAFFGLLSGVAQKLYYDNIDVTDDFLKNELYSSLTDQEFAKLLAKATTVIKVGKLPHFCLAFYGFYTEIAHEKILWTEV